MKFQQKRFDTYVTDVLNQLNEEDNVAATNLSDIANSNLTPETGKKLVQTFKQNILIPLRDGKKINELDKNQVQAAVSSGLIDPKTGTVSDSAIPHINTDPDLTGHFLPASDAAQQATPAIVQKPAVQTVQPQAQPQNSTTTKNTSRPSTNQAGVVSSVYKIQ
jgi:hypothetical protein